MEKYYELENVNLIDTNAIEVLNSEETYDLIVVDLFQDRVLPDFLNKAFVLSLKSNNLNKGEIVLNTLKENDFELLGFEKLEVQDNRFIRLT